MFIGKLKVRKEIDVYKMIGRDSAMNLYTPFQFKNGKIFFQGKECPDAYNREK